MVLYQTCPVVGDGGSLETCLIPVPKLGGKAVTLVIDAFVILLAGTSLFKPVASSLPAVVIKFALFCFIVPIFMMSLPCLLR